MESTKDKGLSKKVYIGNIPYTANKEEVESLLRIVGPVINFELNYDKEAGKEKKHKGFGFCEYPDYETALSAIRNLNDLEFQSRTLKVGFETKAEQTMNGKGPKPDSSDFDPNSFETINENKNLNEILGNLDKPQKYFIMRELKNIRELAEAELKNMLTLNPKLSQEIYKMQDELGLNNNQQKKPQNDNFNKSQLNGKPEKKLKVLKKRLSPKKSISKLLQYPPQDKIRKDQQKIKPIKEKPTPLYDTPMEPHQLYPELHHKTSPLSSMINPESIHQFTNLNEPLYPTPMTQQNRMYYGGVNKTLLMDLQHTQPPNYQNEHIINRGFPQKNMMQQTIPQAYMRNNPNNIPSQQYSQQLYKTMQVEKENPQPLYKPLQVEKEKPWSVKDGIAEKTEMFINNPIFEKEKIKKKINANPGFYQNSLQVQTQKFGNNNNNMLNNNKNPYQEQNENEIAEDAEFSPIDIIDMKCTPDLLNLLMDENKDQSP